MSRSKVAKFDTISVTSWSSVVCVPLVGHVNCAPDTEVSVVIVPEPDVVHCDRGTSQR